MKDFEVSDAVRSRLRDSVLLQRGSLCVVQNGCKSARVFGDEHKTLDRSQILKMHGIEDRLTLAIMDLDDLIESMNAGRASEVAGRISAPVVKVGQGSSTLSLHEVGGKLQWVQGDT